MDAAALERLLVGEGISPEVVSAMMRVPRDRFVPRELRARAWENGALPLGKGQTISQPSVVALMTQAAAVAAGDRVLDVGTGSGYQAAVLAACGARVDSIERIPALADGARRTLAEVGWEVRVHVGDGSLGLPTEAPFDAIVVAAAAPDVPPALIEQLAAPGAGRRGGRLVLPVGSPPDRSGGQDLVLLERTERGLTRRTLLAVVFVPLIQEPGPSGGRPSST